ncbi:hypothetical protein LTR85_002478 [Meristemomyces frigidus]|nr:hypothetical protein LTR85_002478 [Meristemomyces frigidus]
MDNIRQRLEALNPAVAGLWDDSLPLAANIARVVQGETAFSEGEMEEMRAKMASARPSAEHGQTGAVARAPVASAARALKTAEKNVDPFKDVVQAFSLPNPKAPASALLTLQHYVASVFKHGALHAGGVFSELSDAADRESTVVITPSSTLPVPWRSCKASATLVGLLACPKARLQEALRFQSQLRGGLPTLPMIKETPTTSFLDAFRRARELARGDREVTTVMAVSLIDVHIFELAKLGKSQGYTSFAHTFVVGIGPEGVVIWQGWGEHGYGLDEYIQRDGARVRTWQEAGDFVDRFDKMTKHKGPLDAKRNKLYKQLFEVDLFNICGPHGPSRQLVPKFETWVRLLVFEDVKLEDVRKFTFEP